MEGPILKSIQLCSSLCALIMDINILMKQSAPDESNMGGDVGLVVLQLSGTDSGRDG